VDIGGDAEHMSKEHKGNIPSLRSHVIGARFDSAQLEFHRTDRQVMAFKLWAKIFLITELAPGPSIYYVINPTSKLQIG